MPSASFIYAGRLFSPREPALITLIWYLSGRDIDFAHVGQYNLIVSGETITGACGQEGAVHVGHP